MPNVSYCEDNNEVHYEPYIKPTISYREYVRTSGWYPEYGYVLVSSENGKILDLGIGGNYNSVATNVQTNSFPSPKENYQAKSNTGYINAAVNEFGRITDGITFAQEDNTNWTLEYNGFTVECINGVLQQNIPLYE